MRVLMVTQYFPPEPDIRISGIAQELCARGHQVTVITGQPNYPTGQVYPGYRALSVRRLEHVDGYTTVRLPLFPDRSLNPVRRGMNYLSFSISAMVGVIYFAWRSDVVWIYHPPLTMALPAFTAKLTGRPVVYEIQDLWPDTLVAAGQIRPGFATRLLGSVARLLYKAADQLVVISEGFAERIRSRGAPDSRVRVIRNWADEARYRPLPREPEVRAKFGFDEKQDPFVVLYGGTVGPAQALDVVLRAAKLLSGSRVRFVMLGDGPDLQRLKRQAGDAPNVMFMDRVSEDDVARYFAAADALLVHLRDDPLFSITIPSKIGTYLACGRPVIGGLRGEPREIVEQSGAGQCFEPSDARGLARAALALSRCTREELDQMGANASRYHKEHVSKSVLMDEYEELLLKAAR